MNDANENLRECRETLQKIEKGEQYELKSLEIMFDKLMISKQFVSEKENTVSENRNIASSADEDIESILLECEVISDNVETILTKQVIERERIEKEREKERDRLHEKEKRDFEYSCKFELFDRESKERIEIERMQIEKEIKLNRLRVEDDSFTRQAKTVHSVSTKLPKLHIAPFNGNIMDWQSFWDAYKSAIHENSCLNSVDKFNYLKSFLEGRAKKVVEGLDLTSTNYEHAIEILEKRFGKKSVILSTRYSKLHNIPPSSSSTACLRRTLDEIQVHLRSLESLGENVESTHLVVILQSKFPHEVLKDLEIKKDKNDLWTVTTLIENLESYISSIEVTDQRTYERKTYSTDFSGRSGREVHVSLPRHSSFQNSRNFKSTGQSLISNDSSSYKSSFNDRTNRKCRFCRQDHWSDQCQTFPTIEARKKQLKDSCFNCLRPGHKTRMCKHARACYYCQQVQIHHRSLCPKRFKQSNHFENSNPAIESTSRVEDNGEMIEESLLASGEQTLMQTAMTNVSDASNEKKIPVRVFFDTGSHRSYMTEALARRLNVRSNRKQTLTVFTFGSKEAKEIQTPVASVKLQTSEGTVSLKVNIVPEITGSISQVHVNENDIGTLPHTICLADPLPHGKVNSIEFLIGNDYYCDLVGGEKKELRPGLYLLASKFGWILSGRINKEVNNPNGATLLIPSIPMSTTYDEPILSNFAPDFSSDPKMNLEFFWNLETLGIKDPIQDSDDDKALQRFNETVMFKDHRYHVTWPWKENSPNLPDNKVLALCRLKSLIRRLKSEPQNLRKYDAVIQDQVTREVIEQVDDNYKGNQPLAVDMLTSPKHYIPHHAVITPQKNTTKVRVVYDASAKTKLSNKSLNECLYRGPIILEDLCGLLMRWRTHKIALVADIEKAFLQVGLQPIDRDAVRFFWLRDVTKPATDENIITYRFTRIPFGVISSPFLLSATIAYHLNEIGTPVSKKIKENIYVDNLISGANDVESAIDFYTTTKRIFHDASMNIREWNSNSHEVLNAMAETDQAKENKMKVLGLTWNTNDDKLTIASSVVFSAEVVTKRIVLKTLAKIFDPLGFFAPIILRAKLFLQQFWTHGKDWDEKAPEEQVNEWNKIVNDLEEIRSVSILRYVGIKDNSRQELQLHCFCDASGKAFATCVYLKIVDQRTSATSLMCAKCRLCPKKVSSIPRLELMATVIGVRSLQFVKNQLKLPIQKMFVWTD